MRLGDLDALRKNMEFICMGIMAGTEPYNAPLTEIDNAPTVDLTKGQAYDKGFITAMKLYARPQGKWEAVGFVNMKYAWCRCSICHRTTKIYLDSSNVFCCLADIRKKAISCLYCGADMRGDKHENT